MPAQRSPRRKPVTPKTADSAAQPAARRRFPPLLRRCWFNINQAFRRRIAYLGVTPDQYTAMRNLAEGNPKGLTQKDLTDVMSSDPNTIASLLERMEALGWVGRQRHESDGRAYRVQLRPAGQRKYEEALAHALELQAEVLSVLPEQRREEFLAQLERVADACRVAASRAGASPRK
jgi:DNA-binding MarR family transcriptional regulator